MMMVRDLSLVYILRVGATDTFKRGGSYCQCYKFSDSSQMDMGDKGAGYFWHKKPP